MAPPTKSAFLASLSAAIPGDCPICYRPMASPYKTPCNHTFCRECAAAWFQDSASCPTCRATLYADGEGDTNVLPGDLTVADVARAFGFLKARISNLKIEIRAYEGLVQRMQDEVLEWKVKADELQEVVEVGEEREAALERLQGILRERIKMLEGEEEEEQDEEALAGKVEQMGLSGENVAEEGSGEQEDEQEGARDA